MSEFVCLCGGGVNMRVCPYVRLRACVRACLSALACVSVLACVRACVRAYAGALH